MNGYDVPVKGLCDGCSRADDCMPGGTLAAVERCAVAARVFAEMAEADGTTVEQARQGAIAMAVFPGALAEYLRSPEGDALIRRALAEEAAP